MLINLEKFFLIKQSDFNQLIENLNTTLTIDDPNYLMTYILANILAYIVIIVVIKIILFMYYQLFSKKKII